MKEKNNIDLFKPTKSGLIYTLGMAINQELKMMSVVERRKLRDFILLRLSLIYQGI